MISILLTGLSSKKSTYQNFPYALKYNSVINQLYIIYFATILTILPGT